MDKKCRLDEAEIYWIIDFILEFITISRILYDASYRALASCNTDKYFTRFSYFAVTRLA